MPPHPPHLVAATSSHSSAVYAHIPGAYRFSERCAALARSAAPPVPAGPAQQRCCPECAGHGLSARSIRSAAPPPAFGVPAVVPSPLHRAASLPVPMPVDPRPSSPPPSLQGRAPAATSFSLASACAFSLHPPPCSCAPQRRASLLEQGVCCPE